MNIQELLKKHPPISGMITPIQMEMLVVNLAKTIDNNIPGDIVELGCNLGTSSTMYARVLKEAGSDKKLYLYDSFDGLPDKKSQDITENGHGSEFVRGWMRTQIEVVEDNFKKAELPIPIITKGWFKDIPDEYYPDPISFAFFDGDFYDSIMDSFNKVYSKVSPGGIICVHDYGYPPLPGAKIATDEFLSDKPETIEIGPHMGVIIKK